MTRYRARIESMAQVLDVKGAATAAPSYAVSSVENLQYRGLAIRLNASGARGGGLAIVVVVARQNIR